MLVAERRRQFLSLRGRQKTQSSVSENSLFPLVPGLLICPPFLLSSLYSEAEMAARPVSAFLLFFFFFEKRKSKSGQKRPHVMSLESRAAKLLSPVSCVSCSFFSSLSLSLSLSFLFYLSFVYHVSSVSSILLLYLSLLSLFFLSHSLSNVSCLFFAQHLALSLSSSLYLFLVSLCLAISWPLSLMAECGIVQLSTLWPFVGATLRRFEVWKKSNLKILKSSKSQKEEKRWKVQSFSRKLTNTKTHRGIISERERDKKAKKQKSDIHRRLIFIFQVFPSSQVVWLSFFQVSAGFDNAPRTKLRKREKLLCRDR